MSGMRVMVTHSLVSYREAISATLRELRPHLEIFTVEPENLDGEFARLSPQLVVCSRVTRLVDREALAWIELYPDHASEIVVSLDGKKTTYPDVDLETLLSVVEEAERLCETVSEENKAIARRSWEIVNQRNRDLIEEIYPPDFVWHEPDQDIRGYEQAKQFVSTFFAAFPDINITVDDVIAEGEKVVSRYTIRGTHQGETEDFGPPTGKQIELEGITIHRFEDGKIVEEWEGYDNLGVMQQLGLALEQ